MTIQKTNFSRIEYALQQVFPKEANDADTRAAWGEYYELPDIYKNFWRPIEECPKDRKTLYLLANKGKGGGENKIRVGKWREDLRAWGNIYGHCTSKTEPDYYAEILPLPKAQDKDEGKP